MKEIITIQAIEDITLLPIPNLEIYLTQKRGISSASAKTDSKGLAKFEVTTQEKSQLYNVYLKEQNNYKIIPTYNRHLIHFNAVDEIQELRFYKYTDVFRVNLYSTLGKLYLQKGDRVNFKAYHPDIIQANQIQWAYTFISENTTLKKILQENKLQKGDDLELKESPVKCLNNAKYYILKDKEGKPYLGKEIKDYEINSFINHSKMIVFAYTNAPLENVYTEIVLSVTIQISIDCSMREALNATDEVSRLGWTTSYVLQRLWHDNLRYATNTDELIYKNADDIMESMENQEMKSLIKKYAPYITLKPFEIKQNLKENIDPCAFYVELDWEEFYLKFNVMQRLSRRFFHIIAAVPDIHDTGIYTMQDYEKAKQQAIEQERLLNLNSHITKNFLESIQELVSYHQYQIKKDFEGLNAKEGIFTLAVNAKAIAKGIIANKEIYTLIPKIQSRSCVSSYQNYENLARIYPYNIDKTAMQMGLGLDDMDFGMEFISDMENKQAIALYACTGKFSVYYVPATFLLKKENGKISIYIKELYAYVYDTFDFDDGEHKYYDNKEHKDENIEKLGQPVGTWDYNTLKFDFDNSIRQVAKYSENKGFIAEWVSWGFSMMKNGRDNKIEIHEIPALKKQQIYPLYNQDYQDYKQRFNKGLNYRVFSKDKTIKDKFYKGFYIVKVPSDEASEMAFKVEL